MMNIAFIDTLGLCYDGSTLTKRGLGGSESAVIYISRELAKIGFNVTVFNDCTSDDTRPGVYDGVLYCPLKEVETTNINYDIMIGSRSVAAFAPNHMIHEFKNFIGGLPNFTNIQNRSRHKVLWMHDTFCDGDVYIEYFLNAGWINEIFTLSDWHTSYISTCDHGAKRNFDILKPKIFQTRNGIGIKPKTFVDIREKDPMLFVYNASVTKGMVPLVNEIWPIVKQHFPEAKLTVIGGYYKFREGWEPDQQELDWRELVKNNPDINFTGIIKQSEISEILRKASYLLYPSLFPETFGISTLEALAHNVTPITCRSGALEEIAIDIMSYKLNYPIKRIWSCPWLNEDLQRDLFVNMTIDAIKNPYLHQQKMYACNQVRDICTWDTIALQWKQHFYKVLGEFLPVDEYRKVTKINHKVKKLYNRRTINPCEYTEPQTFPINKINVVTPVYNAENYIKKCILSVAQQDYYNYEMFIVDDCSTDNTFEVAKETINSLPKEIRNNFHLKRNTSNMGSVYNYVTTSLKCEGIVMMLDGDDWLINDNNIFHKYNNIYNEGYEFTYGSCWSLADNIPLIAQEYPPEIKATRRYREYKFNWLIPYTHLRTFDAKLLKNFVFEYGFDSFKDQNNNWFRAGGDTSIFYTLIEQADPDKILVVPEIVYNYNDTNPINDYKINSEEQNNTAKMVISRTPFKPGQYDLRDT